MDVPGYKLAKEGQYYYLFRDKALAHAQAVSSKLQELNDIPLNALTSPPIVKDPIVKPGEVPPELQSALAAEIVSQQHETEETSPSGKLHLDNSVEVLHIDADKFHDESHGCFKAEDIKISVIRPSPVKEVPTSPVCDRDNEDATSGSSIQVCFN